MKNSEICQPCQPQYFRLASLKPAPHKALADLANVANPLHVRPRTAHTHLYTSLMCITPLARLARLASNKQNNDLCIANL